MSDYRVRAPKRIYRQVTGDYAQRFMRAPVGNWATRGRASRPVRGSGLRAKPKTWAAKVLKVVQRAEQKKIVQYTTVQALGPYASVTPFAVALTPIASGGIGNYIAQGVGQGDRIGNRIAIKKAQLRCVLVPYGYDSVYNPNPVPAEVRVLILKNKTNPASTPVINTLIQTGDGSQVLAGDLTDMIEPINRDANTVYFDKVFKVGNSLIGGTGVNVTQSSFSNNDFPLNNKFSIDVTKYLPKHITWNDTTGAPTSDTVFALFIVSTADGATNSTCPRLLRMPFTIELDFVDV